ncbi:DUF501 domain-containing protein [Mumia zhuanghuii]|uniref:DUF501 domain-containing protein n=2 Tax=Mumia TaxID=1546255 RepID=A0ABW1QHM0_9ACTN|nr:MULTISPECIES: DUF501 domain-containing protein [Mumia]KAA1422769.1 DUF501 domain-containing protein [Mumia zhuanghuii]
MTDVPPSQADLDAIQEQLGRPARGVVSIASRCPSGHPNVVKTEPRLPDGTPFPTLYYVTCTRLNGMIGTLEGSGLMREMSERLTEDPELAAAYARAHEDYLATRRAIAEVPEIDGVSAGGMPTRVKCLHVLVGHALATGPGVNPLGDEAVVLLGDWWTGSTCDGPGAPSPQYVAAHSAPPEDAR